MKSTLRSPRIASAALVVGTLVIGCVSPDAFFRDGGGPSLGLGGSGFGVGGDPGMGGAGPGGAGVGGKTGVGGAGMGGAPGAGGRTGVGGTGMGGTPGAGGSGVGGRLGIGGSGTGGAPGAGGSGVGGGNGMGTGGTAVTGCPPGIFCDDFEAYTVGAVPPASMWTRIGGSSGDFSVVTDATKALGQSKNSTTFRSFYTSGAGAQWSGATTVTARIKVTAPGSSGATTALVCLRFTTANLGYCLAVLPGTGAQIQVRGPTISEMSAVFAATINMNTSYLAQLSISAAGVLSASIDGTALGTFTPTTSIASGSAAVATISAVAVFDDVVVAQP